MTPEQMIREFQCPGCASCCDDLEDLHDINSEYGHFCKRHIVGTTILGVGHIALGLPDGFNRTKNNENRIDVRLWTIGTAPEWDPLNVPVWAMEKDGFLFVRTFLPRLDMSYVEVIEGGTIEMVPQAIDVKRTPGIFERIVDTPPSALS